MKVNQAFILILSLIVLITSVVCSLIPVPNQLSPTVEPIQQTVLARLTEIARPSNTPSATLTSWPTLTPLPTSTALPPSPTPLPPGAISGNLSYITQYVPPLKIVAFKIGENLWMSVNTAQNAKTYLLPGLPAGKYFVVAYLAAPGNMDGTFGGGYTRSVICGLTPKCTDHSLIEVEVKAGETVRNIHPADWGAPRGAFPKNPSLP